MADSRDARGRGDQPIEGFHAAQGLRSTQDPHHQGAARTRAQASPSDSVDKTIVVRDRRKPNQYTTNNIIAREWLPILRVGDAFFFYSIYLSMANRETESSWGSLRTQAKYLQCGVDLIIRGNRLLEICELIYIDTGNQHTTNEYYILEPQPMTPELQARIHSRLDAIAEQETSVNWQSWVKQVRKALRRHRTLPSIWAERRRHRGGRPVKTVRETDQGQTDTSDREPQPGGQNSNYKGDRGSQPGFERRTADGACVPQPDRMWHTSTMRVSHNQDARDSQPEQDLQTRKREQGQERKDSSLALVREWCHQLGIAPAVVEELLDRHSAAQILQQLKWLSFRNPRDPAAMLVSAVQGDWEKPLRCSGEEDLESSHGLYRQTTPELNESRIGLDVPVGARMSESLLDPGETDDNGFTVPGTEVDARTAWTQVLDELRLQMTRATFDTWLGGAEVAGVSEAGVTVLTRDAYAAEWLQARWYAPIQRTVSGIVGREVNILFVAPEGQDA